MLNNKDTTNPIYHGAFMFNERLDVIAKNINEVKLIGSEGWQSNYQRYLYLLSDFIAELSPLMKEEQRNTIMKQYKKIRTTLQTLKNSKAYKNLPTSIEYGFLDLEMDLRKIMHDNGLLLKYEDKQGAGIFS